ncbi:MAG: ATP-binding protein [Porticoccaceae bacterium]|jgi:signal transduction histidine kinase
MNRLYWKIFVWFWFALALLSLSIGWGVKVYVEQARPLSEQLPQAQVAAISLAFERGDTRKARNLLKELNREIRFPIFVVNSQQDDILGRPMPRFVDNLVRRNKVDNKLMFVTEVKLPNGETYQVIAPKQQPFASESPPPRWLALLITLAISTLVCFWLARYLSSPIARLRDATHRLAGGEFSVRVGDLRGRKDEIADLAADFDTMADKIQQLLHSRQQLLQDISHELRSPLARLQVALALARREGTGALDRIERDLLRLDALIGEVLALSRLESSPDIPLDETVDLSALVAGIISDTSLEAEQKPCTLDARIAPAVVVVGNAELLRRAIENIIRNAIKYTATGSAVSLTLAALDQQVLIQVCDQGAGVADKDLAMIFDPFVRLDSAREHQTGGYGLGLAIASKATELHGGHILARNREDTAGLCVELALPRYK